MPRGGTSGLLKPIGLINMGLNPLGHVGQSFWDIFFLRELESSSLVIRAYLLFIIIGLLPRGPGQTMCPQYVLLFFLKQLDLARHESE